jgi:hypothetical protein
MRRRWHDWVIVISILALAGTGVWTLWGADLARLFKPGAPPPAETPETPPPVPPPPGQAAGPY